MSVIKSALLGEAIGDALGVPVEFATREKLNKQPVTEMIGYGNHHMPKGVWSDDTSMTLATFDSLTKCQGVDYNDMANRFCDWLNYAMYTANDVLFDVGLTTKKALIKYYQTKDNAINCGGKGYYDNGNGSLMRMLPIGLYAYYKKLSDIEVFELVKNSSSITHGHEISIMGCYIYVNYLLNILNNYNKLDSYKRIKTLDYYRYFSEEAIKCYDRILKGNVNILSINDIKADGYIVSTLEAVLWSLLNTDSFKKAIIKAVNLGDDTDTVGAITGSIAGVIYGSNAIPKNWLKDLVNKEYLEEISTDFENFIQNTKSITR